MMCKTCEKQIFFVCNLNTDNDLHYVEKKSPKIDLILDARCSILDARGS